MSQQEVFSKVVTHLLTQKVRCTSYYGGTTMCSYRGPRGTKCAVGCLITDEVYLPTLEGKTVGSDPVGGALERSGINMHELGPYGDTRALLYELQELHDGVDPDLWKERLQQIAGRYGLTMPEGV